MSGPNYDKRYGPVNNRTPHAQTITPFPCDVCGADAFYKLGDRWLCPDHYHSITASNEAGTASNEGTTP